MSHSVTITRTTVASSGTAVIINTGYLSTFPGLLKIAQLLLGAACVGLVSYYVDHSSSNSYVYVQKPELFYLLVATAFLIGTFCLVVACLASLSSATMMGRTMFEVVYHGLGFVMYLCAGLTLLIEVNHSKSNYSKRHYDAYIAAAVMGLVMAALYLISSFLANRHYRGF